MKILKILILLSTLASCNATTEGNRYQDQSDVSKGSSPSCSDLLKKIKVDPNKLAVDNWSAGKRFFYSVTGFTKEIPGVSKEYMDRLPEVEMTGTSDSPDSEDCDLYNELALIFAERYNKSTIKQMPVKP